jgi:hypothetical protein
MSNDHPSSAGIPDQFPAITIRASVDVLVNDGHLASSSRDNQHAVAAYSQRSRCCAQSLMAHTGAIIAPLRFSI